MSPGCTGRFGILLIAVLLPTVGCKREERRFREIPPSAAASSVTQGDLHPGMATVLEAKSPYQENAFAISEGQRLFAWFNCSGCHANGGGGMGPPLIDERWIYGSDPANIFATIVEGRPNGMPSFRGKIPNPQVWQLAAYVRSLSKMVPPDAAPARTDHMQVGGMAIPAKPGQ